MKINKKNSSKLYNFAKKIFPYNRSLTGNGNIKTLIDLKKINKQLKILFFYSGQKVSDWKIPLEWNISDAWIKEGKKKIIDYKKNNLHVVSYSTPINKLVTFKELNKHLFSIKKQPNAIPYLTSYYKKIWGFCIKHKQRLKLRKQKKYHVHIDSNFKKGRMPYGEIFIKGKSNKEIFFSTYICHPSLANNEISGPTVSIFLSKFISSLRNRNYSYRFIFIPETIGSIAYISKNLKKMKKNIIAGFNISCVGDERNYSFLKSKNGSTFADDVILYYLKNKNINFKKYNWLERGSDERQYCSPGVNLPVASLMRTKYECYKEYHTSLDKLGSVVTKKGLKDSLETYKNLVSLIEKNLYFKQKMICEPFMSKRGLYANIAEKYKNYNFQNKILDFLSFCDGQTSLYTIMNKCNLNRKTVAKIVKILLKKKIILSSKIPF